MIFTTNRCNIRPFHEKDLDYFMEYRNNLDWMKYQGFKDRTKEEFKTALLQERLDIEDGTQLAIIHSNEDRIIGDIYVRYCKNEDEYWIGYTINPSYSRQGYAFEVISKLIHILTESSTAKIKAGFLPENAASKNLLLKLNFQFHEVEDDEIIYLWNPN